MKGIKMQPPDGCMEKIKELRLGKAMSYKKICETLVGEYSEITESWVSKWGKRHGLPLLRDLEPDPDCKGVFRVKPPRHTFLRIRLSTMELFKEAKERLTMDYKNSSRASLIPTDDEVLKDLLDKC